MINDLLRESRKKYLNYIYTRNIHTDIRTKKKKYWTLLEWWMVLLKTSVISDFRYFQVCKEGETQFGWWSASKKDSIKPLKITTTNGCAFINLMTTFVRWRGSDKIVWECLRVQVITILPFLISGNDKLLAIKYRNENCHKQR